MNYVIAGPPGSGKTTWAKQNARRGDAIVDVDALFAALSGRALYDKPENLLPLVLAVRDTAVAHLADGWSRDAYVITADGRRDVMQQLREQLGAELIVLEVDAVTCKQRLSDDPQRDSTTDWAALVDKWWRLYADDNRLRKLRILEALSG